MDHLGFQINVFVFQFLRCSASHSGEVKKFNDGFEIAWQVIVEFYEFCWVHEALTNIIRLIEQLPDWESALSFVVWPNSES